MLNKSLLVDEEKTAHMLHKNESTVFGLVGREEMTCSFLMFFFFSSITVSGICVRT
jgi:hypothetical protein